MIGHRMHTLVSLVACIGVVPLDGGHVHRRRGALLRCSAPEGTTDAEVAAEAKRARKRAKRLAEVARGG